MAYLINKRRVVFSAGYSRLMCMVAYRHSRNKRCGERRNAIGHRRCDSPNVEWERFRLREVGRTLVNFVTRSTVREVRVVERRRQVVAARSQNSRCGRRGKRYWVSAAERWSGVLSQGNETWDGVDYPNK